MEAAELAQRRRAYETRYHRTIAMGGTTRQHAPGRRRRRGPIPIGIARFRVTVEIG